MAVIEDRPGLFEALAGRPPAAEPATADPDLWQAIVERLNPARARPVLRDGIEIVHQTTARGVPTVMLRSPDGARSSYVRLTLEELQLAQLMDGTRTVATLVGELVRITGRLAPDQVTRVVADLGANRMLAELPIDALGAVDRQRRRPLPRRVGHVLIEAARGRRLVLANPDRPVGWIYRHGGRLLFTRSAAIGLCLIALAGVVLFARTWALGADRLLLSGSSFATGAVVLLGLNVIARLCHELGHALAAKHAGRSVPAAGVLLYLGIPSAFVDTTDVWMAGRRARLLTTAAGPGAALALAGAVQLFALAVPGVGPLAFKLAFAWYLNTLFNLNPLMALDGYYLLMDWLEVPNLRARAIAFVVATARSVRHRTRWSGLDREERYVALYGILGALWLVVAVNLAYRLYGDRFSGALAALWHTGWTGRLVLGFSAAVVLMPVVHLSISGIGRLVRRIRARLVERRRRTDEPRRLAALGATRLASLPPERLAALASVAHWARTTTGSQVMHASAAVPAVLAVADGSLEARRPGDPVGAIRARAGSGELVGVAAVLGGAPSALSWRSNGARLLAIPAAAFVSALPRRAQPPAERAELESLLDEAPSLGSWSQEDRLAFVGSSQPVDVAPGRTLAVATGGDAALVSAGALTDAGGSELRRGGLLGPAGESDASRFVARAPSRVWTVPAATGLALLLPGSAASASAAAVSPPVGVHPAGGYVPLQVPPGPRRPTMTPPTVD